MERAIVLVNVAPGSEETVVSSLKSAKGVREVNQLYGLYDLLVVVEGETEQEVKSIISERMRSSPGVIATITMKVVG